MDKKVLYTVLEEYAGNRPSSIALSWNNRTLTYGALKEYSVGLSQQLNALGLRKGEVVAVLMSKCPEYIISTLAINRAGGVFMPIEPSHPEDRLRQILKTVAPRFIIAVPEYAQELHQLSSALHGTGILMMDDKYNLLTDEFMPRPDKQELLTEMKVEGNDSCYLIYTSGSTGTPKVIEGVHKSLSHFIHWEVKEFNLDANTRTGLIAPLSFDVSLRDIYVPLLAGGTLFIPPDGIQKDTSALLNWIRDNRLTVLHIVPSVLRLLMNELKYEDSFTLTSLKYVLTAGEPLYGKDVIAWRALAGNQVTMVNLYGPSETTLAKLFYRIPAEELHPDSIVPLGHPLPNTSVSVISNGRFCNVGDTGEIYIKTPFRSKGYYKDPVMTADKFVQNPLNPEVEDIIYRTGDLGKMLADKSIMFVGRADSQVKIRGNRVELIEVEKVIAGCPGIDQNVVITTESSTHELSLCCYYTSQDRIEYNTIKSFLEARLPDYMIPSYFVHMEAFPLNLNGKINKRALPRPEALIYEKLSYEAPVGELETAIATVWGELLGISKVGRKNTFFELGGHSLIATRIVSALSHNLQKDISLKDFFEHNTVAALANIITEKQKERLPGIPLAPAGEIDYPVSSAQKRVLILSNKISDKTLYNMPLAFLFEGDLNVSYFKEAFDYIVQRHESLRTTFHEVSGAFRQRIGKGNNLKIEELQAPQGTEDEVIAYFTHKLLHVTFDLRQGPLAAAWLVALAPHKYLFLFNIHHVITDGWSLGIFFREMHTMYAQLEQGLPATLPALKIQYKDYVKWMNDSLSDGSLHASRNFWRQIVSGKKESPFIKPDIHSWQGTDHQGNKRTLVFTNEVSARIRDYCRANSISLNTYLLSLINIILFKRSGKSDITVGTPVAGRPHADLHNQMGMYLNNLVLKTTVNGEDSFAELHTQVQQLTLNAYEHQLYPYDLIVEEAVHTTAHELYNVLVVMNNEGLMEEKNSPNQLGDKVSIRSVKLTDQVSKLDLSFFCYDNNNISITIEYKVNLFYDATIERMVADLNTLVNLTTERNDFKVYTLLDKIADKLQQQLKRQITQMNVDKIEDVF